MKVVTARPRHGRHSRGWAVGVLTLGCVLLLVGAASALLGFVAPRQGSAATVMLHDQPGALAWNQRSPLTVLLIGAGDAPSQPAGGLIVAQYLPGQHSLSLLAIPSNLWVSVPGFGKAPITQALADGGPRLALVTAQAVLHIPIPYYATINPETSRQLIDAIGPLHVTQPSLYSAGGVKQLDGEHTLRYVAAHPVDDGANLLRRQLQVVLAARSAAFGPINLTHFAGLLTRFASGMSTNVPFGDLSSLSQRLANLRSGQIHAAALDLANGSVTHFGSGSSSMLIPDPSGAPGLARRLLAAPTVRAPGGIAVLNGSGVAGQASTLADLLSACGVPVEITASANRYTYAHTQVVLSPSSSRADRHAARVVATLLQIPVVAGRLPGSHTAVSVVIGADYQDPTQQ